MTASEARCTPRASFRLRREPRAVLEQDGRGGRRWEKDGSGTPLLALSPALPPLVSAERQERPSALVPSLVPLPRGAGAGNECGGSKCPASDRTAARAAVRTLGTAPGCPRSGTASLPRAAGGSGPPLRPRGDISVLSHGAARFSSQKSRCFAKLAPGRWAPPGFAHPKPGDKTCPACRRLPRGHRAVAWIKHLTSGRGHRAGRP